MYQVEERGKHHNIIVSTIDNAYLKVIELYLANYNVYYTLDPKAYGFKYESLLDLRDINQLIIDKKYEEAAKLILTKYQQITIIDINEGKIPEPLDQAKITDAIKECVFNGFNTMPMGYGTTGPICPQGPTGTIGPTGTSGPKQIPVSIGLPITGVTGPTNNNQINVITKSKRKK